MNYEKIPFRQDETKMRKIEGFYGSDIVLFDSPISVKENYIRNVHNCAVWQPSTNDYLFFLPQIVPDNVARAVCMEAVPAPPEEWGGLDMFGVEWVYVEVAEGSMVKPGNPVLTDVNDWKEVIKFPDIDSWDWEKCARQNIPWIKEKEHSQLLVQTTILSGFFERLISFMDFEGAAIAVIDPEQKEAVKELFEALADLYIKIIDKFYEYFPGLIDEICVHDDWGSQRAPFFSENVVRELLVPPMKRLADHIHSKGYLSLFHCCGKVDMLVPCMIDIGWQSWDSMDICDLERIYQTYGDKLKPVVTLPGPTSDADLETYEKLVKEFTDKYCHRGKGCIVSCWQGGIDDDYYKALYRASRLAFNQ